MQKRGFVSVFIIIGLVLLVLIGLLFSLNAAFPGLIFTPKDAQAVKTYTETCLQNIAEEGIAIMQVQGGYIELPKEMRYDPDAYIDVGFRVPMWYYDGRDRRPTIQRMEEELSNYVVARMPECINGYADFPGLDINVKGNMTVAAMIGERVVAVKATQPVEIKPRGEERYTTVDTFTSETESSLGRMHMLATELLLHENTDFFLENYTDEMIACSDYLPYEGMEIDCKPRYWMISDMKRYTQTLVMHNLHFLMFDGTDFTKTGMDYYDKQYKVKFTENDYKDFKVDVIYSPGWGMDFDVNPSDGTATQPIEFSITKYITACVKVYHHKYSTEYPVMFQITDQTNPADKFYFGSPVLMKRGLPNRYNEVSTWIKDYDKLGSRQYCSNTSSITVYSVDSAGVMSATPSFRSRRQNSLKVYARDSYSGEMIPGANVSYHCVMFQCPIGMTTYPKEDGLWTGASPMLDAKFPECTNGLVQVERPGYQTARAQATVSQQTDGMQVTVEMDQLKQMDYRFQVVEEHNGLINYRDLEPTESVIMTLTNVDRDFDKTVFYPSDYDYFSNLSLIVGDATYVLDAKLVNDNTYLGGTSLNWTTTKSQIADSRFVVFNILKKTPAIPPSSEEEWQAIYNWSRDHSAEYPPEIT
jgi:hypothetical protein